MVASVYLPFLLGGSSSELRVCFLSFFTGLKGDGCQPNARYTDKVSFSLYLSFRVFVAVFISVLWRCPNNGGKAFEKL